MDIIDTLKHLVELRGLVIREVMPEDYLDNLFRNCGQTLKVLQIGELGIAERLRQLPTALFKHNLVIKEVEIKFFHLWHHRSVNQEEVIKICQGR